MDKFSLYDLLGLLLPGTFFLFLSSLITQKSEFIYIYNIDIPVLFGNFNWIIILCFALMLGAVLYSANFYFIDKKWYNQIFGMYKHVAYLFFEIRYTDKTMFDVFNKKSTEWYNKQIFITQNDYNLLSMDKQNEIKKYHSEFYDRMYYELEYLNKNDHSKTFHSFYFFFRQIALACIILLLSILIIITLQFIFRLRPTTQHLIPIAIFLIGILIISIFLARWYRKRKVYKMYWTYFTHLILTKNGK
ncbi:MAG: CRISPR-associated protein Csx27 [Bacteroidales bacterium]|nr:CRISPR-associated protein Csx27 [Bacteroidales bacterium]